MKLYPGARTGRAFHEPEARKGRAFHAAVAAFFAVVLAVVAPGAAAVDDTEPDAQASMSAREVLNLTTDRVLAVIDEARSYVDEDPERYYAAVHEVLDPFVDFRGFARGVMGDYATSERYRSLDEAGQEKLRQQLDRFTETMRVGLVRTYSKGLLAFGGSRVEIADADVGGDSRRATLRQLIFSDQAEPYVVIYQMARDRAGHWQLRNLVVENVNLGQIYRSQFESAARRYDGDLDAVIANWDTAAQAG
jgi:phospholipid transport system substrate-binding protein